jgi:DNA-binding IclR family transcriptional regulator
LTFLAESASPTVGVTELAGELAISKAAAHRLLSTLRAEGLVEYDEELRRYKLGAGVLKLSSRYLDDLDVLALARSSMRDLSLNTNETVTISIRSGDQRVYVDQVTPPREVIMTVELGRPFPLHAGSSGKAFLAFLDQEYVEHYLGDNGLASVTPDTVTDARILRRHLQQIRRDGFAQSFGERLVGAGSTAAPIFSRDGQPVAVMSVCGPAERFRQEASQCSAALIKTTTQLSTRLGYDGVTKRPS